MHSPSVHTLRTKNSFIMWKHALCVGCFMKKIIGFDKNKFIQVFLGHLDG